MEYLENDNVLSEKIIRCTLGRDILYNVSEKDILSIAGYYKFMCRNKYKFGKISFWSGYIDITIDHDIAIIVYYNRKSRYFSNKKVDVKDFAKVLRDIVISKRRLYSKSIKRK